MKFDSVSFLFSLDHCVLCTNVYVCSIRSVIFGIYKEKSFTCTGNCKSRASIEESEKFPSAFLQSVCQELSQVQERR